MAGSNARAKRVKYPLVVKLIGIISIIVVVSMAVITGLSSYFFSEDSRAQAEENNLSLSQVLASQIEGKV
jgi:adenylate cyclase